MREQRRKPISIFAWMLRAALAPLLVGLLLVALSVMVIWDSGMYADMPFAPVWLLYGVWPWYVMLGVGLVSIFFAWLTAKQWQTGIFLSARK